VLHCAREKKQVKQQPERNNKGEGNLKPWLMKVRQWAGQKLKNIRSGEAEKRLQSPPLSPFLPPSSLLGQKPTLTH